MADTFNANALMTNATLGSLPFPKVDSLLKYTPATMKFRA